jgi:rare lipoprotein A
MRVIAVFVGLCWVAAASAAGCSDPNKGFRPPATATTHADANQGESDPTFAKRGRSPSSPEASADQAGLATWYGGAFAGKKTANGERFDPSKYTAAHRKLPFGTWVEVRRADTGRTVRVRINDRGPWGDDRRIIDLSRKAAEELDIVHDGVAKVELRVVNGP